MKVKNEMVIVLLLMIIFAGLIVLINLPELSTDKDEEKNLTENIFDNGLKLYFRFDKQPENNKFVHDFSGNENNGIMYGNAEWNKAGGIFNDGAFEFDGMDDKIIVSDSDELSPSTYGGNFTVCFFIRFNNKNFIGEGSEKDYLNYLGKGNDRQGNEWLFRQYNSSNSEGRENRLSFYIFNKEGGLGAGSYFQDDIKENEWIFVAGILNGTHIKIYKNGELRSVNPISEYGIKMENTKANFNIGTYNSENFFNGSIDELRIYGRALNDLEVTELYNFYQSKK